MENATKALLIAGTMLLIILVLTLAIYVFTQIAAQSSDIYGRLEQSDIDVFNQQFLQYEGRGTEKDTEGRWINPLKIQDVVSIINMAKDNNSAGKMPVKVKVNSDDLGENLQNKSVDDLSEMIKDHIDNEYKCQVDYAIKSELIETITITQIK